MDQMPPLTSEQLGNLLYLVRHDSRRSAKRYLHELKRPATSADLDRVLEIASRDGAAIAEAHRLGQDLHDTLSIVEEGAGKQLATMMGCVRAEMDRQGLAPSELAARCNVPQSLLSAYLAGEKEPATANLMKMATALGCEWRLNSLESS